ncbi:glutaredoxin 4-like isoform X5 [Camellia sinensis]|nr:glutaredoxin 4-like isoform X5 [Camellia sinensis]
MLYMKGVPDLPRCGFSSLSVRVLKEYNVHLSARNILEGPELKNAAKAYRGLLKFMTDRGRIYLSTSRCNFRGTDMLNNGHMMIMFLAVTSRFAMAMVPFARTATSVTMMSPTMIVTSSMVTTTTATMSAITVTMLMNMMSPAMTVVLVNKMSPAVTVMPSDVTSCTSVMSTGTVVS